MKIEARGGFVSYSCVPSELVTEYFNSDAVRFEMNFRPYLEAHATQQDMYIQPRLGWTSIEKRIAVEKLHEEWDAECEDEVSEQESIASLAVPKVDVALAVFCWAHATFLKSYSAVFLTEEGEQVIFIPNARGAQHFVQVVGANIDVYAGENLVFPIYNPIDNERIAA